MVGDTQPTNSLDFSLIQRFEIALSKMTGSREANLRPLVAVVLFPIAGLALGVLLLGLVLGALLGVVGYLRTRKYYKRWPRSITNLSVWVPTEGVEYGDITRAYIEIVEGMGVDKGLQYGLLGWSNHDPKGLLGRISGNWRSDLIYERWFPLEVDTGGAEVQVPVPPWEPAFAPRPEADELTGPIGLRHHTRWVVAVRQTRYGMDWQRSEAVVRSLSRVIATPRPDWDVED